MTDGAPKSWGTCAHFKRTFPTSERLKHYGSCKWPLPKGLELPAAWQRKAMESDWGPKCKVWKEKA